MGRTKGWRKVGTKASICIVKWHAHSREEQGGGNYSGGLAAGANHLTIVWVNRPHSHSAARPGDTVGVICSGVVG